jgi:glycosyltransferase involved in cell wall biosynthesis
MNPGCAASIKPRSAVALTVICVAYKRYREIPVLIHSFLAQTLQNFKLIVLHDGYDQTMHQILSEFKERNPSAVDFVFSEVRYNDWGHTLRDIGIQMAETDYLLITNDDNYYCPVFVENMFAAIDAYQADIVLCDMIHSHNQPGGRPQPAYSLFQTAPKRCAIDIGCFIARTELAKAVGFRDKSHDGDATYFEDLVKLKSDIRIAKVPHVLFVHN